MIERQQLEQELARARNELLGAQSRRDRYIAMGGDLAYPTPSRMVYGPRVRDARANVERAERRIDNLRRKLLSLDT